jgi:hypothetical protein
MRRLAASCFAFLALALPLSIPESAHAAESYDNCTGFITSIPTVITTQGTWCLKHDLATAMTSGAAIIVNTNNVTIDCNDFKLGGLAGGVSTSVYGIEADSRLNISVRHCNIRGFLYGVFLHGSSGGGHAVEDNRFDGNTYIGVLVVGDGSVVRHNRVFETGGSTLIADAFGILAFNSVDILDNTVSGATATSGDNGDAIGIYTSSDTDGSISGNRVRRLIKDGGGLAVGIEIISDVHVAVRDNDLMGPGNFGLLCGVGTSNARDNMIGGFTTGLSTCYDGGNLVRP